jgi:hypothetical protein
MAVTATPRWDSPHERLFAVCMLMARRRIHKGSGWQYDPHPYVIEPEAGGRRIGN